MGVEIERKFLVKANLWELLEKPKGNYLRQGYLSDDADCTVRVRETDKEGFLTIKGRSAGIARAEYEYPIAKTDARQMMDVLAKTQLAKTRYQIAFAGHTWDVDEFHGLNEGLIVAEIELAHPNEAFEIPEWIDKEVSDDPRYFNSNLARKSVTDT
jgi:adenylate cyclase